MLVLLFRVTIAISLVMFSIIVAMSIILLGLSIQNIILSPIIMTVGVILLYYGTKMMAEVGIAFIFIDDNAPISEVQQISCFHQINDKTDKEINTKLSQKNHKQYRKYVASVPSKRI